MTSMRASAALLRADCALGNMLHLTISILLKLHKRVQGQKGSALLTLILII